METIIDYLWPLLFLILSYLIGSFPTGVLYSKSQHNIDVRTLGSGGSGGTNIGRNFGFKAAVIVTSIDILKGFIPVFIAKNWFADYPLIIILTALACMIGHAYPIWANFQGGKIVATSIGVMLAFNFWIAFVMLITLGLLILITSTVSLSAMVSYSLTALYIALTYDEISYKIGFILSALFLLYRHRENISRLIKGTENRINFGFNKPKK
ncbi:glycerol-3-phosphate 1-O-acyltransferase PlsY [Aerococcaceae bacterium WGS1372]